MVNQVRDQAQRREALDPSRSFIVQAPAGSGKTELLIQRFLKLLARADQPESIVAITFTRKAAAEMRHRVIEALQSASGPEPVSSHEKLTWKLAEAALAQNDRFDWSLTEHPSRLRIQTIDSFCATLVRRMPWVSRMGSPPQPEDDVTHLYRQAARRTLAMLDEEETDARVSNALRGLLAHLDNKVGTIEKLLSTMLGSRDQWLRHVIGNAGNGNYRDDVESAVSEIIEDELEQLGSMFPERFKAETLALIRFAAGNLAAIESAKPMSACGALSDFPGSRVESLPHWLGLTDMFLTRGGKRRANPTKNEGFPSTDVGRSAKDRLRAVRLDPQILDRLHALRSLPPVGFEAGQWDVLGALLVLLPFAVAQLRLVFQEEGRVDFTEISIGARSALGSDAEPTDLAFALDCRIDHLLIDEFQDTSQSQYDLLTRIVREWQPTDGRTLFLVGDPMQSIYGFREAEVGLFLRARTEGVASLRLKPLTLSVNFRSGAGIVVWVNKALGVAFPTAEDRLTGAVTYEPSTSFKTASDPDAVEIHPFFVSDAEPESDEVLRIIQETKTKHPDGTIAVLVRSRTHLFSIVSALRRTGEKFRAVEIDALGERPAVQDLLALTRALSHSGDRVAWLSILRAPWCGLTLSDLETLVNGDSTSSIWRLVQDLATLDRLSLDGRSRLEKTAAVLSDALARRGTLPLGRWVEGVWIALGGPACLESKGELEDARAYLDLLEESTRGTDIRDERKFAEDVDRLFAPPDVEAGEDLQLLTVHKSKGLEFDTVILPGLGRRTRGEDQRLLMWLEYMGRNKSRLLLAPIHEMGGDRDPLYEYLRMIYKEKDDHESARLLYVAATRARERLHLLGHVSVHRDGTSLRPPDARSLLRKIWATLETEFAEAFMEAEFGDEEMVGKEVDGVALRRLSADWCAPAPPEEIAWKPSVGAADSEDPRVRRPVFEWAGELQRRVGVVVHRMLQQNLPDRQTPDEKAIRLALRSEGLDGQKLDEAVRRTGEALRNAMSDERGQWILSPHSDDERELKLTEAVDGRVRRFVLDHTFLDGGTRWIVDYKTSSHEGSGREAFLDSEQARYREQLEDYARVMATIDPHPIRLGLYFPLLQGWREWPFEERQA